MDEVIRGRRRCSGAKMRFLRDFRSIQIKGRGVSRLIMPSRLGADGAQPPIPALDGRRKRTLADLAPNGGHHLQIELNVHTSGK